MPVAQLPKRELIIRGSTIITPEQAALDRGLVGEWRFDRNTGLTVPDYSGYGNHGTASGTAWQTSSIGPGLHFGGAGDNVTSAYNSGISGSDPYTMEVFAASDDTGDTAANVYKYTALNLGTWAGVAGAGARICVNEDAIRYAAFGVGGAQLDVVHASPQVGVWFHIIATFDGNNIDELYVDGVNVDSGTGGMAIVAAPFIVGTRDGGGFPYEGQIALARLYNRVLIPAEVRARYQITRRRMQSFGGERRLVWVLAPTAAGLSISVSDSVSVTESVSIKLLSISVSDNISVAESVAAVLPDALAITVSDSVAVAESISAVLPDALAVSVSESVSISESIVIDLVREVSVSDSVSVAESISSVLPDALAISISDSVSVSELVSVAVEGILSVSVSDSVSVAESVDVTVSVSQISVSESVSVAESVSASLVFEVAVSDSVSVAETVGIEISTAQVVVSDSISVSESIGVAVSESQISVSDNVSVSESVTAAFAAVGYNVSVSESVGVAESIVVTPLALAASVTDTISVAEAVVLSAFAVLLDVTLTDALKTNLSVGDAAVTNVTVSDASRT